jgi:hypothetical protein
MRLKTSMNLPLFKIPADNNEACFPIMPAFEGMLNRINSAYWQSLSKN